MPDIAALIQSGSQNLWIFIPTAILLGALHGLEPGHSKTMMTAFIVAIKGTLPQAVLLGLAATISHTAIVWSINEENPLAAKVRAGSICLLHRAMSTREIPLLALSGH